MAQDRLRALLQKARRLPAAIREGAKNTFDEVEIEGVTVKLREAIAPDWRSAARRLLIELEKADRTLIFILDELPAMLDRIRSKRGDDEARNLMAWFRTVRLQQTEELRRHRFLVGGSVGIDLILRRLNAPDTLNDFERIYVEPIAPQHAVRLVDDLARGLDVSLPPATADRILELIGPLVPYFIHLLFSQLAQLPPDLRDPLTPETLDEVYRQRVLGPACKHYFDHYRTRLGRYGKPLERAAIAVLGTVAEAQPERVGAATRAWPTGSTLGPQGRPVGSTRGLVSCRRLCCDGGRARAVTRHLCQRLLWAVVVLFGITLAVFLVVHLSGDPAALYMGPEGTREDYELLRRAMGFDRPLPEQYGRFLVRAVQGDFGRSLRHQQPSLPLVLERFPATLRLAAAAMVLAILLAVPLGILSAIRRDSPVDTLAMTFALSGQCMPTFWLGILLILVFAVNLRWVPVYGGEGWLTLLLPAVTLGVWAMARTARITRSSMLEVLQQDFLRTARAKGLGESPTILRHALRNGAIPIVTALGLETGNLLGGAVITEAVFAYPGIGRLAVEAVVNKDVPLIQAVVFTVAGALLLLNIAIDLVYVTLDPRVRLA